MYLYVFIYINTLLHTAAAGHVQLQEPKPLAAVGESLVSSIPLSATQLTGRMDHARPGQA